MSAPTIRELVVELLRRCRSPDLFDGDGAASRLMFETAVKELEAAVAREAMDAAMEAHWSSRAVAKVKP